MFSKLNKRKIYALRRQRVHLTDISRKPWNARNAYQLPFEMLYQLPFKGDR